MILGCIYIGKELADLGIIGDADCPEERRGRKLASSVYTDHKNIVTGLRKLKPTSVKGSDFCRIKRASRRRIHLTGKVNTRTSDQLIDDASFDAVYNKRAVCRHCRDIP